MANKPSTMEDMVMPVLPKMQNSALPAHDFWAGKRVLLTGHTGFKGAWLVFYLQSLGAEVCGLALPPHTQPNLFELLQPKMQSHWCDLRNAEAVRQVVRDFQPEIIFHLAAQALVRPSYQQPLETFSTNTMGTAHLLDALRDLAAARVVVVVTTDKVYRNHERAAPYVETDQLGGHDPYSASKTAAEIIVGCYRDAFLSAQGVALATARAGNVIGGGDWSIDRIIPDAWRAWRSGGCLQVRRPAAVRPWQHVLEPLNGYLILAQQLWRDATSSGAWNFGPAVNEVASVRTVVEMAQSLYGNAAVTFNECLEGPHEAELLMLDASKAQRELNIWPRWNLAQTLEHTMCWYQDLDRGESVRDLCQRDLCEYVEGENNQ